MTTRSVRLAACTAVVVASLCAACSSVGSGMFEPSPQGPGSVRTPTGESLAPQAAMDKVVIGKSRKADVSAALGPAIAIPFDSGYEVWVYRWPGADKTTRAATELVVLFDPSGLAAKARIRPGYPSRD